MSSASYHRICCAEPVLAPNSGSAARSIILWLTVALMLVAEVTGTGTSAAAGQRVHLQQRSPPLDDISMMNLRRFVCGSSSNAKCMNDERFYQLRPEFLRKLSARFNNFVPLVTPSDNMIPIVSDKSSSSASFSSDPFSNDVNIWNSLNLSGRREGPFYVDEPDYVLTHEEHTMPLRIFDYVNDPFIPQRGRRRPHHHNDNNNDDDDITIVDAPLFDDQFLSQSLARHMQQALPPHRLTKTTQYNGHAGARHIRQAIAAAALPASNDFNAHFRRFVRLAPRVTTGSSSSSMDGSDKDNNIEGVHRRRQQILRNKNQHKLPSNFEPTTTQKAGTKRDLIYLVRDSRSIQQQSANV